MASKLAFRRLPRPVLVADGCLLTAGAFGLLTGLSFGLEALGLASLDSAPQTASGSLFAFILWFLTVLGFFVGPAATWLLYRRRVQPSAVVGGLAGYPLGAAAVLALTLIAMLSDLVGKRVTPQPYVGPVAVLIATCVAFLVLTARLVREGLRDLGQNEREHGPLDVARLLAAATIAVFAAGLLLHMRAVPGADVEPGVFLLAAGVIGGAVVAAADFGTGFFRRQAGARAERL